MPTIKRQHADDATVSTINIVPEKAFLYGDCGAVLKDSKGDDLPKPLQSLHSLQVDIETGQIKNWPTFTQETLQAFCESDGRFGVGKPSDESITI